MLNLKLREEFLGSQMPETAIALCRQDKSGAAQRDPSYILSLTYPTADVQKALYSISVKRRKCPVVLMGPDWLAGAPGFEDGEEAGGFAGALPQKTAAWYEKRLEGLRLIEVRGRFRSVEKDAGEKSEEDEDPVVESDAGEDGSQGGLPPEITLADGTRLRTGVGTVPEKSTFTCRKCGRRQDILEAIKPTNHTAPVAAYALQCHCPECEVAGFNYGGRYFKAVDEGDVKTLFLAEKEWFVKNENELTDFWPRSILPYAWKTSHWDIQGHGYSHWWKMFHPRQLLVHAQLLRCITDASEERWPLDVREQALGAFQQYLRNQNMFVFWNHQRDTPEPMFSNANFHPKQQTVENCTFHTLGRGNWQSCCQKTIEALRWSAKPWELFIAAEDGKGKSEKMEPGDAMIPDSELLCGSATDLSLLADNSYDLVITDPPFGDNVNYADLADFFYVWLRIPLLRWYQGKEKEYWQPEFTPKATEAVDNKAEHPDDREEYEKHRLLTSKTVDRVRELTGNRELSEKDPNPLWRPEPSSEFYRNTLTACWAEAARLPNQAESWPSPSITVKTRRGWMYWCRCSMPASSSS